MPNPLQAQAFIGYKDDPRNAFSGKEGLAYLTSPSKNVRLTLGGEAFTRPGYEDISLDLTQNDKPARGFYMTAYDLTFYAVGTKVYYTEGQLLSTSTLYDTGITITDGQARNTRFDECMGNVIITNKTNGSRVILVTRLNGAVSSGAATITTDKDGATRANRFDAELLPGTKNLRINGTNETYTSVADTGIFTLTGTASQAYTDNTIAIVVYDTSARFPKCSKIMYSAANGNSLYFIGLDADDTTIAGDAAPFTIFWSQFVPYNAVENVLKITGGTSGGAMVGQGGELTNILATKNYIYLWKKNRTAYIIITDINQTTGVRQPNEFDQVEHGCLNEDCAVSLGGDTIVFLTPAKRIIAIKTKVEDGSVILFPDETFDQDIRNTLKKMDEDQPDAMMFYHTASRLLYIQISVSSQLLTLVYDNNIGKWLPPDDNKVFASYFDRKGTLFATDLADDVTYQIDLGTTDNGNEIDCVMAHGLIDAGVTTAWKEVEIAGSLTQDSIIAVNGYVDGGTPTEKYINASDYSFTGGRSFSDIAIGNMVIGGSGIGEQLADYEERKAIAPVTFGKRYQTVLQSSGAFTWKSYKVKATSLTDSARTLK